MYIPNILRITKASGISNLTLVEVQDFIHWEQTADLKWVRFGSAEFTLRQTNIAMKNGPLEDVFPIEHGDIPLLCYFTRGYPEVRNLEVCS